MIEKEQARWSWSPSWRCRKGSGNTTEGRRWSRLSFLSKISLQLDHFARLGGTTIPKIPRKVKQDLEVALNTGSHRHVWNATYLWSSLDRDQSTSENRSACNRCRRLAIWIWVSERSEQICIDYIHLLIVHIVHNNLFLKMLAMQVAWLLLFCFRSLCYHGL